MRASIIILALALAALGGCTSNDACAGLGTCLAVDVTGTLAIDQLILQVSGEVNGTRTVPPTPHAAKLPQTVALEFAPPGGFKGNFTFSVGVLATDKGVVVGNGSVNALLTTGDHASTTVRVTAVGAEPAEDLATSRSDLLSRPDLAPGK